MDQIENKHWTAIAIIAVIGFSFWWLDQSWKTDSPIEIENISYEMPRPKIVGPEYDLSGRRIVYNLTETERRIKAAAQGNVKAVVPKTPGQDVKAKQQAAKQAAATAEAKKKAAKKTAEDAKRKAQLGVRIVEGGLDVRGGLKVNPISDLKSPSQPAPNQIADNQDAETPLPVPGTSKDDEPKKTANEWRALLFSAPKVTKNGMEFYKAYQAKELNADDFYKITGDLLSDAGSDRQKLALSIFKLDVSEKTFTILVSHYTEQTPQELRTQIYVILKTYGDLPRFGILSNLLKAPNPRVVTLAVEVLKATVAAQVVQRSSGNTGGRSPGAAAIPPKSFGIFLPALGNLAKSKDDAAISLLASIEALMTSTRSA